MNLLDRIKQVVFPNKQQRLVNQTKRFIKYAKEAGHTHTAAALEIQLDKYNKQG